jgi:hypothetical protein
MCWPITYVLSCDMQCTSTIIWYHVMLTCVTMWHVIHTNIPLIHLLATTESKPQTIMWKPIKTILSMLLINATYLKKINYFCLCKSHHPCPVFYRNVWYQLRITTTVGSWPPSSPVANANHVNHDWYAKDTV